MGRPDKFSFSFTVAATAAAAALALAALFAFPDALGGLARILSQTTGTQAEPSDEVSRVEPLYADWDVDAPTLSSRYAAATDNTGAEDIPEERRGAISEVKYIAGTSSAYFTFGEGAFINKTNMPGSEAAAEAAKEPDIQIELYGEPQVLIYHTHATESFDRYDVGYYDTAYPSRSTSNEINMVSLGAIVAEVLNENGIAAVQSDTQHDYPQYNGSYGRSRQTISEYLKNYPSIKVVLDLHRDAISSGSTRIKPVVEINGIKAAQIMVISGADNEKIDHPNYLENLRLAARIQDTAAQLYPGLMRPARFAYALYNQNMSTGALLVEIGTHANSLTEAQYSAELFANVLVKTLCGLAG